MPTSQKRAKELARAKQERRMARAATQAANKRRRQRLAVIAVVAALLLGSVGFAIVAGQSNGDDQIAAGSGAVDYCESAMSSPGDAPTYDEPGDGGLGQAGSADFTLGTNCGDIAILADAAAAPETVNAMAFLANDGYFDGTTCHRLTTEGIFVLQCGDPTGTGTGSPGFELPDENLPSGSVINYPAGTVAMANSGPGTAGSQFFIVYADTTLPASYTIWGTVIDGLDIVSDVADVGTVDGGGDGTPLQTVMIQQAAAEPVA